jgi:hypothetical protein
MHHVTLSRCLAVLGLSACTSTSGEIESPGSRGPEPGEIESPSSRGPEPSGLDMDAHTNMQAPLRESGPRYVSEQDQWCQVLIDVNGRKLEPTPSFLQAWNMVAARGQRSTRYVAASPQTEDDARVRICGRAGCTIEQPQIIEATVGGGKSGIATAGFGVLLPTEQGPLVVPVAGVEGSCLVAPEIRVARSGSLMHVTAIVHQGDYTRYYHHGGGYEGHGGGYGGCQAVASSRTDIVVDIATAQLELVLTQVRSQQWIEPLVEALLRERTVELHGCSGVLELAWTG